MKKRLLFTLFNVFAISLLTGCGGTPADTIVVGASITPHAKILEAARPEIEKNGFKLEIREFTDYVLPNTFLESKELDANYFQHLPYLLDFNNENNTHLVSVGAIHFEPLGIYPGKKTSLNEIESGDTIAIPNDTTNGGRALLLLHKQGIITLNDESKGFNTSKADIKDSKGIEIKEIEAANIPNVLQDVSFGVVNGNYALSAGIANKALVTESTDSLAAQENANIIAVRDGDEQTEKTKVLCAALKTDEIRSYIKTTFGSSVIPVF